MRHHGLSRALIANHVLQSLSGGDIDVPPDNALCANTKEDK